MAGPLPGTGAGRDLEYSRGRTRGATRGAVSTSPRWGEVGPRLGRGPGEGVRIFQRKLPSCPPHPVPLPNGERQPALTPAREPARLMLGSIARSTRWHAGLAMRAVVDDGKVGRSDIRRDRAERSRPIGAGSTRADAAARARGIF